MPKWWNMTDIYGRPVLINVDRVAAVVRAHDADHTTVKFSGEDKDHIHVKEKIDSYILVSDVING